MVPSIWHARLMSSQEKGGKGVRGKWCQERVKKLTISRRDAEAQRFELNNCFIFFVDSAARQSPVGMIPAFSTMRTTVRSGARVRCRTPWGTTKPWRALSSTVRSSRSIKNRPSIT